MRGAILTVAVALLAGACAAAPKPLSSIPASARAPSDYRHMTCGQLAVEVARTQRAFAATQRQMRVGEDLASYYLPISLSPAPTTQASRLSRRLEDLQRASRAKRCSSVSLRSATA